MCIFTLVKSVFLTNIHHLHTTLVPASFIGYSAKTLCWGLGRLYHKIYIIHIKPFTAIREAAMSSWKTPLQSQTTSATSPPQHNRATVLRLFFWFIVHLHLNVNKFSAHPLLHLALSLGQIWAMRTCYFTSVLQQNKNKWKTDNVMTSLTCAEVQLSPATSADL